MPVACIKHESILKLVNRIEVLGAFGHVAKLHVSCIASGARRNLFGCALLMELIWWIGLLELDVVHR